MEHGMTMSEWVCRLVFLIFMTASTWQDVRKRSISLNTFQTAGIVGVALRMGIFLWRAETIGVDFSILLGELWDVGGAVIIGILLLWLSSVTEEAVGRGDGSFFVVSGIYLGFWKNLVLLWGGLLLSLPICAVLMVKGRREGRSPGSIRLPFLPFVFVAGIGVMLL